MKLLPLLTAVTNALYKPSFTDEPAQIIQAVVGETVNLTCRVEGESKPNKNLVQWVKGSLALGFPPIVRERYEQMIGPDDYSLKIENVQLSDEDDFECQITPHGMRSQVGKLEIITPPKTVDVTPVDKKIQITRDGEREILEVVEGVPTRLRCIATDSKPKTNVTWQINGDQLDAQSSISGDLLLTTVSELTLIPQKSHHNQAVSCFAINDALPEPIQQLAYLNVQTTPEVSVELVEDTVYEGEVLKAKCNAVANPPVQSYKWFINDRPLDFVSETIQIDEISYTLDQAQVTCQATNQIGASTGSKQIGVKYLPRISQLEEAIIANKSSPFELICEASGNPAPEITWINDSGEVVANGAILGFESINYNHFGSYSCHAQNELGEAVVGTNISIRGTPFIRSPTDQASPLLKCDFVAEPRADYVEIVSLDNDEVVFFSGELDGMNGVEVKLEEGNYECRVNNALGMSSSQIILQPKVLAAGTRIGIVCAVLLILIIMVIGALIKLRFFAREHRLKLANNDNESQYDREDNRMNHDISFPFPISAPIPAQASFTDKNRLSLLRSSSDDEPDSEHQTHHHHYHMHHHHQLNQTVSEKVLMIVPSGSSDNGSTGRSAHDDGYGTESGSNQKVHTVSSNSDSSNSDYEVNVPSLSSSRPYGEKESKICVIWDDETTYEPAKYSLQMSRARSVSHV